MNDMNGEMNGISWDGELEESDIKIVIQRH